MEESVPLCWQEPDDWFYRIIDEYVVTMLDNLFLSWSTIIVYIHCPYIKPTVLIDGLISPKLSRNT